VGAALGRLEAGLQPEAAQLLATVVSLRDDLEARSLARRLPLPGQRSPRFAETPHALRVTGAIELAAAQALALLEGPGAARDPLERLLTTKLRSRSETRGEALAWLAALRSSITADSDVTSLLVEASEQFPAAEAVFHRVVMALSEPR
jgi:hypothetical protein